MVKSTRRAIKRVSPERAPTLSPLRAKARIAGVIADNRALALTSRDWKGTVPGGPVGVHRFALASRDWKGTVPGGSVGVHRFALTSRDWKGAVPGGPGGCVPLSAGRGSFRKFESEFDERAAFRTHLSTLHPILRTLYTAPSWRRNCERA